MAHHKKVLPELGIQQDLGDRVEYLQSRVASMLGSSEEQNFDLAKLIFIRVWYVHADPINFI
jgi:hypothetical protein